MLQGLGATIGVTCEGDLLFLLVLFREPQECCVSVQRGEVNGLLEECSRFGGCGGEVQDPLNFLFSYRCDALPL